MIWQDISFSGFFFFTHLAHEKFLPALEIFCYITDSSNKYYNWKDECMMPLTSEGRGRVRLFAQNVSGDVMDEMSGEGEAI